MNAAAMETTNDFIESHPFIDPLRPPPPRGKGPGRGDALGTRHPTDPTHSLTSTTGPNNPPSSNFASRGGEGAVDQAPRSSRVNGSSPTSRLCHVFATAIRSTFSPGLSAAVTSIRYGGVHATPHGWPLT